LATEPAASQQTTARVAVAVVSDLFFASRLSSLADRSGVRLLFASSPGQLEDLLTQTRPSLVLVDLANRSLDAAAAIRRAKGAGTPLVLAFGPHKDLEARSSALAAGADRWVTNQRLLETLGELFGESRNALA
jgi:CheY-like chemotaxis protein